jgi:catechol 2,3-dioxygenase-like lactoylglutathione lyase family enzyme
MKIDQQITFLYTTDLKTVVPFYETVLGFELVLDQGKCRIYRTVGRTAYIGICERPKPRQADGVIFTLVTQDVDGWYQQIVAQGIQPEHEPRVNDDYGIYHFFVKDPSGYLLEFQQFLGDLWESPDG